jgi:hypothetical protein
MGHMFCCACASRSKVLEAPCTSLDVMRFDILVFVLQQLKRREEDLVSSRHPVFVLYLCCS